MPNGATQGNIDAKPGKGGEPECYKGAEEVRWDGINVHWRLRTNIDI